MLMRIAPCGHSQNQFGVVLALLTAINKVAAKTRLYTPSKIWLA